MFNIEEQELYEYLIQAHKTALELKKKLALEFRYPPNTHDNPAEGVEYISRKRQALKDCFASIAELESNMLDEFGVVL
tara:strand:+ start:5221 stop:5454 length:234 start_codon:yes stop_codon:yes gene_type:complete